MEQPNILFICTDQEQAFPLNPVEFRLPARERLRRNGLTFLNFQACTTLCTSSRSVIYSGQHAPRSGMWDNLNFSWIADLSVPTLGHMMRQVGYYTAYKGRWLLSEIPENDSSSALEPYGFADYQEDGDLWGMPQEGYRRDKEVAADAGRWLLERAPIIEQDQPWLLAVNFLNPRDISFYDTDAEGDAHGPGALKNVSAPEDEFYKFNWQPALAASFDDDLINQPEGVRAFGRFSAGVSGFVPHDRHDLWQAHLNYYLNCLRDSDQWLGVVLDALEESGQAERTVIIFTSDHGEMGTAHGLRQTGGAAFRELVNVPFIVCHPQLPGKLTTEALGSAVDIVPTILGLSGLSELSQEDRRQRYPQVIGRDLSSVISNPSGNGPRGTPAIRGDGVLYTYDMVHSLDVDWFLRHAIEISDLRYALGKPQPAPLLKDLSEIELPDLSKRRMFRGVFDGRYKLIRYFSPDHYNTPQEIGELVKHNDLALYDLVQDPDETRNLANTKDAGYDEALLLEMNKKLNALISVELGEDSSVLAPLLSKPSDPN